MPFRVSFVRMLPNPIRTHLKTPISAFSRSKHSFPSAGSGASGDTVIPPSHNARARTLVLCFDGTGDQFNADNSNVVNFVSMLKKGDKNQQLVYYQAGIGTYTIPQIATPLVAKWEKTIDMAIAIYLDAHVMGGYEFLMEHYHTGDKICIFGFSRGAYTARALAGMINKVGLLPSGNHQQVPFAYKMYSRDDETGRNQSTTFKKAFSMDVDIEFVGVWDTVCSVGIIPHSLPFTRSNTAIRHFRHAMSLDERRAMFKANYYHLWDDNDPKSMKLKEENDGPKTDVREVWFAGCHCDVGGGSVKNGTRNSLARIPLRWMIRECFRANTGIQFYRESFKSVGLDPDTFLKPRPPALTPTPAQVTQIIEAAANAPEPTDGPQYAQAAAASFKSEEDEELADALSPKYDRLKLFKPWWILEILPILHRKRNPEDHSLTQEWKVNLGHGRKVPAPLGEKGEKVLVHRSVWTRMQVDGLPEGKYDPRANFQEHGNELVELVD